MTMPAGIATVTLTGRYVHPDGTPFAGNVSFTTPDYVRIPGADTTAGGSVTVTLDVDGSFSVILIATDNDDARPTNFTYTVVETLTGVASRTYHIALPQATGTINLADIAPAAQSDGEFLLVAGPAGRTILNGTGAPTSGDGTNGDFWINTATWTIYGPKASGTWPAGHSLGSGGAVSSVNGQTGVVVLAVADISGAASTSSVTSAVSAATSTEISRADGKYLAKEGNLADLTDPATARTNLGVTPAAIGALTPAAADAAYAPLSKVDTGAWVFNVKAAAYGAAGDGKVRTDGAMTSGSAVLTCATSTPFTSADVGKKVMVKGAGATGVTTLTGTISTFTDSGHVTLSVNASTTVTNAVVMWATDDTTPIQNAINDAVTWAQANGGAARVFIPVSTGFYGIGGALVTGGTTKGNAQLTLPVIASTGRKVVLTIEGATNGAALQHWEQTVPQTAGSTLVSFGVHASVSAQNTSISANGNGCVIGGPAQPGGYGVAPGVFSNMLITLKGINILTAYSLYGLTYTAFDFSGVANAHVEDVAYGAAGVVPANDFASVNQFANGLSIGALLPANGNNDYIVVRNVTCHGGYTYALYATEHATVVDSRILYSWAGLCVVGLYFGSVGATHAIKASQISVEACTHNVMIVGVGSGGVGPFLDIDQLDTETSTPSFTDTTSGTGLAAALGTVKLTGLYTVANLTTGGKPTGLNIVDGQNPLGVRALTGATTVRLTDRYLLCATSSAFTATLQSAGNTSLKQVFRNTGANTLTLAAAGSETIDGSATKTVAAGASVTIVPSGGNWVTV
ncbi:hypothetical protein [Streptomyces canus]|uniref:hypothetical protein n=1 Tax=Streptomyces canus TaxID=58343 RepID=UPI003868BA9A|nr:hypothetical protein OH824_34780 [Streptomyces canus]